MASTDCQSQQFNTALALCGRDNIVAFSSDENSIANTGYGNQLINSGFSGRHHSRSMSYW